MAVKVGMVSLGCSKNQVDGEIMLSLIQRDGYELCGDAEQCDVVIINTCAFIEDAKRESIENILEFCELKRQGVIKAVVVTGCLAERYQQELVTEIPEADVILGIGRNTDIVNAIDQALQGERVVEFAPRMSWSWTLSVCSPMRPIMPISSWQTAVTTAAPTVPSPISGDGSAAGRWRISWKRYGVLPLRASPR